MAANGKFDAYLFVVCSQVPERIAWFVEFLLLKHLNFKAIGMMNEINGTNPFRSSLTAEDEVDILIFYLLSMLMKLHQVKVRHLEAYTTIVDFPKPAETEVIDEFFVDLMAEVMRGDD